MQNGYILALDGIPNPKPKAKGRRKMAKTKSRKGRKARKLPRRNSKGRFVKSGGKKRSYKKRGGRRNPKRNSRGQFVKKGRGRRNPSRGRRRSSSRSGRSRSRKGRRRNPIGGFEVADIGAFAASLALVEYVNSTLFGPRFRNGILGGAVKLATAIGLAYVAKMAKFSSKTVKAVQMAGVAHLAVSASNTIIDLVPGSVKFGPFLGERQYRLLGERQYRPQIAGASSKALPAHLAGNVRQRTGRGLPRHLRRAAGADH